PQAALDAPRVHLLPDGRVAVEPGIPTAAREELARRGHPVVEDGGPFGFGGGQVIWRDGEQGLSVAGSGPRKDGLAVGCWRERPGPLPALAPSAGRRLLHGGGRGVAGRRRGGEERDLQQGHLRPAAEADGQVTPA